MPPEQKPEKLNLIPDEEAEPRIPAEPNPQRIPTREELEQRAGRIFDEEGRREPVETALEQEDPGEDEPPQRNRTLPVAVALVAMIAFAGVVWYAYTWGVGGMPPEELPVIRAEPGPIKTKPESPGGMEIPHQDKLVLNEVTPDPEQPQVERLLPPPETPKPPKPLAAAPEPEAAAVASEVEPSATAPAPAQPAEQPAETSAPAAPAKAETPTTAESTEAQPEEIPPAQAQPQSKPPPPAKTQTAAVPPAGGFVVQIASLKDPEGVDRQWARLRKRHPELLGERQLIVQEADLGSRGTFYRLQAGFFAERAGAEALCAKLKAKGQDCLVAKR